MKNNIALWIGIIVIAAVGGGVWISRANSGPAPLDGFAQCLTDKGAIFYGAFWCPHCQNQKKAFGTSEKKLAYVECSLPNGKGQTQEYIDKKVEGYPTWEFADQSRESGELSLARLAEKTGCELPDSF
ncbi:MAG: hypothetical protein AAB855_01455 [Patescibacteria group bacterium]